MPRFNFFRFRHFISFSPLSFTEIKMLSEGIAQLFIARIKVSFRTSGKWMPGYTTRSTLPLSPEMQKEVMALARIINRLSAYTPWKSTCLVKVLAAHHMLLKRGITPTIHIGVNKNLSKGIKAHAWLSVENKVLIGGEELGDFQEISRF